VHPGDKIPSIPENTVKFGSEYQILDGWFFGGDLQYASSQYARGDNGNQSPQLPSYTVVNLNSRYVLTKNIELFAFGRNIFDQHYKTFAQLGQNFFQNGQATQFWGPGAPATELPLIFFLSWRTPCRIMMAIAIDGHRRRHGTSSCYVSSQIVSTICP